MKPLVAATVTLVALAAPHARARADGAGSAGSAEPVPVEAKQFAAQGRALYDRGDYLGAIDAFKGAFLLAPSPGLEFNLAQAYRLAGDCSDAAYRYRRFLASGPSPEQRAVAEQHLATVQRCASRRGLGIPDPAKGSSRGPSVAGDSVPARGNREEPAQPGHRAMQAGVALAIAGGVAAAVGVYEGTRAMSASSDVEDAYARGEPWSAIAPVQARGEHAETAERWLFVGGGTAIAAGAVLYLVGHREARRTVPVILAPTSGGATVAAAWRF